MGLNLDDRQKAGLALFAGGVQFAIGLTLAEIVYDGYSMSRNFISNLGNWGLLQAATSAYLFNGSIILLGASILVTAWFLFRSIVDRIFPVVIVLAGIGAIGVGVFSEVDVDEPPFRLQIIHTVFSFIAFFFSAVSALFAFRIVRAPFNYLSVVLGVVSLVALGFFATGNYAGLGVGGMERMVVWPVLTWAIGFGGYLLSMPPAEPAITT
jgi:hypothetical membrane protein